MPVADIIRHMGIAEQIFAAGRSSMAGGSGAGIQAIADENTSLKSWSPNSAWTKRFCRKTQADQWLNVSVTRQGTIIYVKGESAIRDSGSRLEVSEGITQDGLEIALSMAMQRFGRHIAIEGDSAFRECVLHTASALKLGYRLYRPDGETNAIGRAAG